MIQALLEPEFLRWAIPLIGTVVAWFANERRKRAWEEYQRKEENYKALLAASRGFYLNAQDTAKKSDFLQQVDLCWLYCTDEVIQAAYRFLESVKTGTGSTDEARRASFGSFMVEIRKDMLRRRVARKTQLVASDYRLYKAN